MINNFDEYCRALSSSGEENQRARLMKYLRGLSISGEFLRVTKFATRLEIRRGEKSFTVEFRDTTLIRGRKLPIADGIDGGKF